jgi:formylglycine-generating enzyme required for sulfatase activity
MKGKYSSSAQTNPQGPSFGYQVIRGGSFYLLPANFLRVSIRDDRSPSSQFYDLGFRLVCDTK